MNKIRRRTLQIIKYQIEALYEQLEELQAEEEEYRDNMPENLQGGEKYEKAEDAITSIEEAVSYLNDACDAIETAME